MSAHKPFSEQAGYTLVELAITMTLIAIVLTTFLTFFKTNLFNYLNLQSDASSLTQLDSQSTRLATVVRGAIGITSGTGNDMVLYSYFYPQDSYVSLLHYYLVTSGGTTKLMADVTPMTANPPIGTPLLANKATYTIIDNFYQPAGGSLFTYLDAAGTALTQPISDLTTIKGVQINLAAVTSNGNNQAISVQVTLRNRKVNL